MKSFFKKNDAPKELPTLPQKETDDKDQSISSFFKNLSMKKTVVQPTQQHDALTRK